MRIATERAKSYRSKNNPIIIHIEKTKKTKTLPRKTNHSNKTTVKRSKKEKSIKTHEAIPGKTTKPIAKSQKEDEIACETQTHIEERGEDLRFLIEGNRGTNQAIPNKTSGEKSRCHCSETI